MSPPIDRLIDAAVGCGLCGTAGVGNCACSGTRLSSKGDWDMSSVLQEWVMEIGWKMQSILLSGFRGPDNGNLPAIKAVNRWLRRNSQNNADPSKDYMREDLLPSREAVCDELEFCTSHYVHHFADSLRVMAIYHPDLVVRTQANDFHNFIAEEIFHFVPENDGEFSVRHKDRVEP